MPHFTLQITPAGPILGAFVAVSASRRQALADAGQPIPPLQQIRALIDTGASCTCIDPSILSALSLTPTGSVAMHTPSTAGTPVNCDQYDVGMLIPAAAPNHNPFFLPTLAVTASELSVLGIQALIGRDILADCFFTYNGSMGLYTLAF